MDKTNANFWDCECHENYIHRKDTEVACNICGAYVDNCPDSLQVEVQLSKGWEDRHTLSTVHLLDGTLGRALSLQMDPA